MRFLTCRACGHSFTASLSGQNSCPRCGVTAGSETAARGVTRSATEGNVLITLTGTAYRLKELEALRMEVDAVLQGSPESIAFHFDGASYLDSSMISQLVRTLQEMTRRGKPTFIITGDAQVLESLQILDLDRVLTVFPSVDAWREELR